MSRKTEQKIIKNLYSGVILTLMAAAVMFSLFLMSGARAESKIYYVTVNGGATLQDGSSWENAFPAASLDYALTECYNNTDKGEVRAAKGLYTRKATLKLPKGVKLTGGWDTETKSRDITKMMANPMSSDCATILSRDASVTYMSIVTGGTDALSNDTCIDGFTITGGTGTRPNSTGTNYYGGGMYNSGSSPTVTNCSFSSNSVSGSDGGGGGMYNFNKSCPTVINCSFSNNSASGTSGGGGGMYNTGGGANPTVTNCTFSSNSTSGSGGGMYNSTGSSPTVTDCTFSGNSASGSNIMYGGGGMYTYSGSPTVTNCTFSGNSANFGGGINNMNSSLSIINCTFSDNSANNYGGGICKPMGGLVIANSVIWGNKAAGADNDINVANGTTTVRSSVLGSTSGTISTDGSVLSADPMIVSVDKDMKVTSNSKNVCIYIISGDNVQNSSALGEGLPVGTYQIYNGTKSVDIVIPSKDGLGQTRSTNYVDLGAYQYAATTDKEVYGITLSQTSADLEIGQSVSFDVTTKPINNSVLSAENPYANVSVSGKTVTLTAKTKTNGKKTIAVKATYGTGGHVSSTDFTLTVLAKTADLPAVTDDAITDRDGSGIILTGDKEDLAIYGGFVKLSEDHILPSGIEISSLDAIPATSSEVTVTSADYFITSADIKSAVSRWWNANGYSSADYMPKLIAVQNTVCNNPESAEPLTLWQKFWQWLVGGNTVQSSRYLPLQTNFTITSADIPANIWNAISSDSGSTLTQTFLKNAELFVIVRSGSDNSTDYARSIYDTVSPDTDLEKYITVSRDAAGMYTIKTRVLLFDQVGGVTSGGGKPFVQPISLKSGDTDRASGNYFIVQDGKSDKAYNLCMAFAAKTPQTYHVTPNGSGNKTGGTWKNAISASDLTAMLRTRKDRNDSSGCEIKAAAGEYNLKQTLHLTKGIKLTGAWKVEADGTTASRDITKMMANPMSSDCATILSRDASVAYMSIVTGGKNALSNDTSIDGFTITGGTGTDPNSSGTNHCGGGMYNANSSPAVTNCFFSANSAGGTHGGGGMYNTASSPTVTNCSFSGNSANGNKTMSGGGGMFNGDSSNPTVTNCSFSANSASNTTDGNGGGGGMCNYYGSSPTVTNCSFSANSTNGSGGGMYNNDNSSPTVANCTFSDNQAKQDGGGMYNYYNSSPTVANCTISGNSAKQDGGGMCSYGYSRTVIANSIIWGNKAKTTKPSDIYVGGDATTVRSSVIGSTEGTISTDGSVLSADPMIVSVDKDMKVTSNSKDVCIYIISGDNVQSSSALGEGLPVGTYQIYNGTKSVDIVIPSKDGLGQTRRTNYVDIGAYRYTLNAAMEVYEFTISKTSADLEIGQSVNFNITTKPINNSVLSAENPYADVSVSGKTVTLSAKARTNGKKTIAVKATYGTGGHVSSADFTLTVTAKSTPKAEVTEDTRTDKESSGVIVISKDTAEDLAIYDSFAELADKGELPAGISVSADAIQAKSRDVKTDEQIYTSDDIKDAIARYWNLETASKDKVRIVQVQNTITEEGGSIFAKFWRFLVSFFTGGSVNDSGYLPLQTNFTITSADIASLPDEIKDSLTKETLLSKISLFAVVSEDGKTYARSLNDISKDKVTVSGSSSGYTVKTKVLLFNMKGGVKTELKPGAKWVQAVKDYFIVQDGAKDDSYSLCMAFAAKETNYASLTVTTDGVLPEASSDFTITAENGYSKNVTSQSVWSSDIISEDTYTVTYKNISGYTLTLSDDTKIVSGDTEKLTISKDIKWGQTWNVTATYRYKPITAITVTPKELSFYITGPTDVQIKTITYEAAAELFISSDKWETADDIISIDKTTGKTTTVTAKPVKNAGRASQDITITVTGKDGTSTKEKATVWVTNAYIVKAGETLTISKDTMLYSLEIESGGTVTISNDAKLSITDTMNAAQDSHINLDGNSSIEVRGKATGKPTVTVTNSNTINIKTGEGSTITYPETIVSGDKYPSVLVVADTKIVKSPNTITTCSLDLYVSGDETSGYKPNITPASFDEQLNVKFADIKGLYITEIQATEQDDSKTYVISFTLTSRDIPVRADKTGLLRLAKLTADGTYTELLRVKELNLLSDGRWLIKSQGKVLAASDAISGDKFEINIGVKDNGLYDRNPKSHDVVDPAVLFCDGSYKDDPTPATHSGSGGCSTGLASLSLLAMALLPFAAKKRKK